jgi:euchromatic histone-lysine N-methyltransferase
MCVCSPAGFGHNVNHVFEDMSGQTSLHAAAQEGHLATVHLLVQAGAQLDVLDCEQLTPLMQAVLAGHAPVVKYLVKAGASLTLKVGFISILDGIHKCFRTF